MSTLFSFERSLRRVVSELTIPIGVVSLQSARSVFFTRGNIFVKVSLPDLVAASISSARLMANLATSIDNYLITHTVQPPSHRIPRALLKDPILTVRKREMFQLCLEDYSSLHASISARSNNGHVVVPQGPADIDGVVEFYALDEGEVEISIFVAHYETMFPGRCTHTIRVIANESEEE